MVWTDVILPAIGGSVTGLVGSIAYFRPQLKQARAGASKAETEASEARFEYMVKRIEGLEKLYAEQGEMLDTFRTKQLTLESELQDKNRRIVQLEAENRSLSQKVEQLEIEVQSYKMMIENG